MCGWLSDARAPSRLLLGALSVPALTLIAVGILGVVGYAVVRRTREMGVRMALGAQRLDVVALVVRQALGMTAAGLAAGAALSLVFTRVLATFLFETSPRDPLPFVSAAGIVTVLALVASYFPARRATRVDPLVALRTD